MPASKPISSPARVKTNPPHCTCQRPRSPADVIAICAWEPVTFHRTCCSSRNQSPFGGHRPPAGERSSRPPVGLIVPFPLLQEWNIEKRSRTAITSPRSAATRRPSPRPPYRPCARDKSGSPSVRCERRHVTMRVRGRELYCVAHHNTRQSEAQREGSLARSVRRRDATQQRTAATLRPLSSQCGDQVSLG